MSFVLCFAKQNGFLIPPHLITKFELQKYKNESIFNGVYSRDNLPKIKDGAYIINFDECSDIGTHWVALWVSQASPKDVNNNVTYFDSFGENIFQKILKHLLKAKT